MQSCSSSLSSSSRYQALHFSPLSRLRRTPAAIGTMQTALAPTGTCVSARSHAAHRRPRRAVRLACRAGGSLNSPASLIGCHSQVWVGGWDKQDIIKSVEGTKNAGFDLIEGTGACRADHPCRPLRTTLSCLSKHR